MIHSASSTSLPEEKIKEVLLKLLAPEQKQLPARFPNHVDAIEPWVLAMKSGTLNGRPFSHHTVNNYLRYVKYFINTYGNLTYESLEHELSVTPIEMFGRKDKFFRAMMCFANYLANQDSLDAEFLQKAKRIKPKRNKPPKRLCLTEADIEKLLGVCENDTLKLIILFLASTGLRASEFCDLQVGDVDFENRFLVVQRGKGGKRRRVGLNETVTQMLEKHLTKRPQVSETDHLFLDKSGKKMIRDGLLNRIRRLGVKAGVEASPHAFRRAFVTINANKGRSLVMLQIACGHSDIKTTRSYCQTSEDEVINAMKDW